MSRRDEEGGGIGSASVTFACKTSSCIFGVQQSTYCTVQK